MTKVLEKWQVMPHGPLERIDEGLLTVAGEIHMPLGNFPRRMTVVGLESGRTAIWSAIALNEPEMAEIENLGEPSFLIVPGDSHRLDSQIWKSRYADMKVLTPPGARKSVTEVVPVDATTDILGDPSAAFQIVRGVEEHEAALIVRRPAGTTLILNDIIGHVAHPHGLGANVIARLFGFGVSAPQIPRPVKAKIVHDGKALAKQFRTWALLPDLKRIIVSHGDPIEANPAGVLTALAESLES